MKNYLSIVILLFLGLSLNAQAPQGFNYQATVRNSAGELIIKSNVYFKFNVIQGSQTAVPVFTETHYVPTDNLGQVNLVIGQGTPSTGIFSELDWSLGSYYLGIELSINGPNDYVAMGTTQLLSVPYAMHANTADSSLVWSENANDIYFSSGNIGLGTNNPGILNYSHPVKVFTLQDLTGATSIEMSGNRISDGESIGWITYLHDSNRILDMVVTRENSGSSGSLHVRTNNGDGGTNPSNMTTQFTITESGDVFLNHSSNGVIMKSPDGQCWKFTVGNTGDFVGTSTTCPN